MLRTLLIGAVFIPTVAAAAPTLDVKSLGTPVEACTDFDEYVNGLWKKATPIPADRARIGSFESLRDESRMIVEQALAEDIGSGDATSAGTIPEDATCTARIVVKEPGIVAGVAVAHAVFATLDDALVIDERAYDGDRAAPLPFEVLRVAGPARSILAGERVALNILGRLCGIATLTRAYVDAVAGTGATIRPAASPR